MSVTCVLSTQVVRAAEETASVLAGSIHSEQCVKVLCPIIQTADYPVNLAAIKMQTRVIERISQDSLLQLLPDIIPGLLQVNKHTPVCTSITLTLRPWVNVFQGYDNTESSVRKASVFCLVAIYSVIGEDLKPHLQQLTGSKVIQNKRAQYKQTFRTNSIISLAIAAKQLYNINIRHINRTITHAAITLPVIQSEIKTNTVYQTNNDPRITSCFSLFNSTQILEHNQQNI